MKRLSTVTWIGIFGIKSVSQLQILFTPNGVFSFNNSVYMCVCVYQWKGLGVLWWQKRRKSGGRDIRREKNHRGKKREKKMVFFWKFDDLMRAFLSWELGSIAKCSALALLVWMKMKQCTFIPQTIGSYMVIVISIWPKRVNWNLHFFSFCSG